MANPEKTDPKQQKGPNSTDSPQPEKDPVYGCSPLDQSPEPPSLKEPEKCAPDPECHCPGKSVPEPPCFSNLISSQATLVAAGERANKTKKDLEKLLEDATKAKETYTRKKYDEFKDIWLEQDKAILTAIGTAVCNVPCWRCVLECHLCQLLYRIRWIEKYLDGSPDQLIGQTANTLRDLQYWHQRNVAAMQRRFDWIDKVLKAWSDPAKTIDAALKANQQIIDAVRSMNPAESLVKVFFELIPRHLAIAPRPLQTAIDKKYIELCAACDPTKKDDCCGPDVGPPSARQRLVEPQAYILDPDNFFNVLCCLATQRLGPAKLQLEEAQAELDRKTAEIATLEAELDERVKDPFKDYRTNVGTTIDCDSYNPKNGNGGGTDDCGCDDGKSTPTPTPAPTPNQESTAS